MALTPPPRYLASPEAASARHQLSTMSTESNYSVKTTLARSQSMLPAAPLLVHNNGYSNLNNALTLGLPFQPPDPSAYPHAIAPYNERTVEYDRPVVTSGRYPSDPFKLQGSVPVTKLTIHPDKVDCASSESHATDVRVLHQVVLGEPVNDDAVPCMTVSVAVLQDVSHSMLIHHRLDQSISALKASISHMFERSQEDHRVSYEVGIWAFADRTYCASACDDSVNGFMPLRTSDDLTQVLAVVDRLHEFPKKSTNIEQALTFASSVLSKHILGQQEFAIDVHTRSKTRKRSRHGDPSPEPGVENDNHSDGASKVPPAEASSTLPQLRHGFILMLTDGMPTTGCTVGSKIRTDIQRDYIGALPINMACIVIGTSVYKSFMQPLFQDCRFAYSENSNDISAAVKTAMQGCDSMRRNISLLRIESPVETASPQAETSVCEWTTLAHGELFKSEDDTVLGPIVLHTEQVKCSQETSAHTLYRLGLVVGYDRMTICHYMGRAEAWAHNQTASVQCVRNADDQGVPQPCSRPPTPAAIQEQVQLDDASEQLSSMIEQSQVDASQAVKNLRRLSSTPSSVPQSSRWQRLQLTAESMANNIEHSFSTTEPRELEFDDNAAPQPPSLHRACTDMYQMASQSFTSF
jgi:hypothetical protein